MLGMRFLRKFGCCEGSAKTAGEASGGPDTNVAGVSGEQVESGESHFLKTIGWVSAALGAVALGLIVGREIRQRYKFNRRTPYDLYAHSGDELPDVDCGVGI
jgi:hypothetical protein